MGATGIEPVTSSASRKRSPTELSARYGDCTPGGAAGNRTRVEGFADPCLIHSATAPKKVGGPATALGADDRIRTGDLNLGKVALYQLSYVRGEPNGTTDPITT